MRIERIGMRAFSLPLVRPFATAHGRIDSREGWLLALTDEEGRVGFGEATPLPSFGTEDSSRCESALEEAARSIIGRGFRSLEDAFGLIGESGLGVGTPCAMAALDSALCDLEAQRADRSLAAWIRDRSGRSGAPLMRIRTQALVGGEDPKQVEARARTRVDQGFGTFKLKLAVSETRHDIGQDLERVAALRSAIGPSRRIRLDANEAWSRREAERALVSLEPFDIEYVEQPVGRADLIGLKSLVDSGAIPVAADEALLGSGWQACLEAEVAPVFILKPAALGGVRTSIEIARRAGKAGIRIVWSNLIEAAVGRSVAVALAAALAPSQEVHGLGTAELLAEDLAEGARVRSGWIDVGRGAGLGCAPDPSWADRGGATRGLVEGGAGKAGSWTEGSGRARVFEAKA